MLFSNLFAYVSMKHYYSIIKNFVYSFSAFGICLFILSHVFNAAYTKGPGLLTFSDDRQKRNNIPPKKYWVQIRKVNIILLIFTYLHFILCMLRYEISLEVKLYLSKCNEYFFTSTRLV